MVLSIAKMTETDLPGVLETARASFSMPWSEYAFVHELNNPRAAAFVAREGDELAGYVIASFVADEAEIMDLAVRPGFRRRGIASRLLKFVMDELRSRGAENVYLEVRASNEAALRLYEALGFVRITLRRGYYQKPADDAVVMRLVLAADTTSSGV